MILIVFEDNGKRHFMNIKNFEVFFFKETPTKCFSNSNINGHIQHHKSGPSENGRLSRRSSSGSLDLVAEHPTGVEETGWNGLRMPETDKGFVNSNDRPKTNMLETVNNREL